MWVRQNIFLGAGETTQSAMCCHARMRIRVQSPATMWKGGHVLRIPWSQWWRSGQMDFRSSWPASPADHQGVWGSVRDCSPLSHPPKVELTGEGMCTHTDANITHSATHTPHFSIVHFMGSIWNTYLVVRNWLWTGTSDTCDTPCSSASGFS